MHRTSGPKAREQVDRSSCSNGMLVKFIMLASTRQEVRTQVVRCPVPQFRMFGSAIYTWLAMKLVML